jgi:porin
MVTRMRAIQELAGKFVFLAWTARCVFAAPAFSQTAQVEPLPGPDSHETGPGPRSHLFGEWGGVRTNLENRGVKFDFQYVSDTLWNIQSEQAERRAMWNRFRGTVDLDFGALIGQQGLYFHATGLLAGRRQSGSISGAPDRSQRVGQREHLPPRFMVDREAMAG